MFGGFIFSLTLNLNPFFMKFDLNIADDKTFLGGQNVHNLIIIGLLVYVAFYKK